MLLIMLAIQYFFVWLGSLIGYPKLELLAFSTPYLAYVISIALFNWVVKNIPDHEMLDTMRNHSAEHLISEREMFNKESIYSFGCSNSHIVFCFLINIVLLLFMPTIPIVPLYILSMFISGELVMWLVFHQDSFLAKLFYPLIVKVQSYTLLPPYEQHLKTAQLTMDKLKELENEN